MSTNQPQDQSDRSYSGYVNDLVSKFNSLPRPQTAPSGLIPNTWHFSLRHVPLQPPRDLVFLVELQSWFVHAEDSIQPPISTNTSITLAEKAREIVPLLLSSFNSAFGIKDPARVPAVAPWRWMTNDEDLAKAVAQQLRSVGVRQELCDVGVANREDDEKCHEEWCRFVGTLSSLVDSI